MSIVGTLICGFGVVAGGAGAFASLTYLPPPLKQVGLAASIGVGAGLLGFGAGVSTATGIAENAQLRKEHSALVETLHRNDGVLARAESFHTRVETFQSADAKAVEEIHDAHTKDTHDEKSRCTLSRADAERLRRIGKR